MNEPRFGEVRALLQSAPGAIGWRALCEELDGWSAAQWEQGLAYVAGHLERWPDALRLAPTGWIEQAARGDAAPGLALVRALELDAAHPIMGQLARWSQAEELTTITQLVWRGATPDALALVADMVRRGPGLVRLELAQCAPQVSDAMAWVVAELTGEPGALRALRVSDCALDTAQLADAPLAGIEVLELRGVQLTGALDALADRAWWRALEGLRLAACGLEPGALSALPCDLRALDLSYNGALGDDGVEALCARRWETLEALELSGCKVGDAGLWALAACGGMPRLALLALRQNAFGAEGAILAVERAARFAPGCRVETF
jgi:hypothetical protein